MKPYRVITLDAFTTSPFAGNPCAVLPEAEGLSDEQMQAIARETNLPETAFVLPSSQADFRVRYFTPRSEIPFAGHPTIATSFMLALEKKIDTRQPVTEIRLEFNIGVLPVEIHSQDGKPQQAVMTQQPPTFGALASPEDVAAGLGLRADQLRGDCVPQTVSTGVPFLIVALQSVDVLGQVRIDRERLAQVCAAAGCGAAFAFSLGGFDPQADTHARLIDPKGTFEDPFTGSASGSMGAYIVHYRLKPSTSLLAEQGHFVHRPGYGRLEIDRQGEQITRVRLGGPAVKVMDGNVFVP